MRKMSKVWCNENKMVEPEHRELWPGSPSNEESHEDQYVLVREWGWGGHLPFCSLWDTIWWGIMMSVNPRRVKFYFQLPTIWEALCKQRPFQLWIPKLYWSLIIICIHKAIHDRLLQELYAVMFNIISMCHSSIPRFYSDILYELRAVHCEYLTNITCNISRKVQEILRASFQVGINDSRCLLVQFQPRISLECSRMAKNKLRSNVGIVPLTFPLCSEERGQCLPTSVMSGMNVDSITEDSVNHNLSRTCHECHVTRPRPPPSHSSDQDL